MPIRAVPRQWQTRRPCNTATQKIRCAARSRRGLCNSPNAQSSSRRQIPTTNARQTPNSPPQPPTTASRKPDSARFVLHSSALLLVGFVSGFSLVWGWKTWNYLRIGTKIAEAGGERSNDNIIKRIERTNLIDSLEKEGWIEDEPLLLRRRQQSRNGKTKKENHLINETLLSRGGLVTRYFRHPVDSITVVVFMADHGCESWPDVVHGGVTTCLIDEALDTHLKHFTDSHFAYDRKISMNYRLAVNPHVVYSVVIRNDDTADKQEKINVSNGVEVQVLVNQMTKAPHYVEKYNEETKDTERTFQVYQEPKSGKNVEGRATLLFRNQHSTSSLIGTSSSQGVLGWMRSFFTPGTSHGSSSQPSS